MSAHEFVLVGEDEANHKFACKVCSTPLWFNKPGLGSPNARGRKLADGSVEIVPSAEYMPGASCNPIDACPGKVVTEPEGEEFVPL